MGSLLQDSEGNNYDRYPGMVDVKSLISHRFKLEDLPTAMAQYLAEKDKAVKAIMVNE